MKFDKIWDTKMDVLQNSNFSTIQARHITLLEYAQSWTALFRAFISHRQPSASLTKLFPSWTRLLAELDKL